MPDPLPVEEVRTLASTSAAYEASHIAKAGRGRAHAIYGYSTAAGFIQLHDSATLPADTAVPASFIACAANANWTFPIPSDGQDCLNGITISTSSTGPTKTIGTATAWFSVLYR